MAVVHLGARGGLSPTGLGQVGKHLLGSPWGEADVLWQDCILCMSYGEINRRFGATGWPKVRSFCSNCYHWVGESQPPLLVRTSKTATIDFCGGTSQHFGLFPCSKEMFQNGFFPLLLFQSPCCKTEPSTQPHHTDKPK